MLKLDIDEIVRNPVVRHVIDRRGDVLDRYGPKFRNPSELTRQDYLEFLSFKHNHHWQGLERTARNAAEDLPQLRSTLTGLVDETQPISTRFETALDRLHGVGKATLTPILLVAFDDRYGVWNGTSEAAMRDLDQWPNFPRRSSMGEQYEIINDRLMELASTHNVNLWTLDVLYWGHLKKRAAR